MNHELGSETLDPSSKTKYRIVIAKMVNVLMGFVFVIQGGLELRIDLCTQTSKYFSKNIIFTRDRSFVKFLVT